MLTNRNPDPQRALQPTLRKVQSVTRRTPAAEAPQQQAQRQPFRVLQTSRAPAQLSLFLRPAAPGGR